MSEHYRRRNRSEPLETHEFVDAAQEELQRQARRKLEKETALMQQAAEEEQQRKALEAELQYASMLRRQREQQEREAEDMRKQELDTRRRLEKAKRVAEAKKLQEWRDQQAQRAEQVALFKAEYQRQREEERRKRILSAPNGSHNDVLSGWVTIQSGDSLSSKRRFCTVRNHELSFCKDASTTPHVMETISTADITKVSDNEDDFEGLETLQHAFGLHTRDGKSFIVIPEIIHQVEDFIAAVVQVTGL